MNFKRRCNQIKRIKNDHHRKIFKKNNKKSLKENRKKNQRNNHKENQKENQKKNQLENHIKTLMVILQNSQKIISNLMILQMHITEILKDSGDNKHNLSITQDNPRL